MITDVVSKSRLSFFIQVQACYLFLEYAISYCIVGILITVRFFTNLVPFYLLLKEPGKASSAAEPGKVSSAAKDPAPVS